MAGMRGTVTCGTGTGGGAGRRSLQRPPCARGAPVTFMVADTLRDATADAPACCRDTDVRRCDDSVCERHPGRRPSRR